MQNFKKYLAEFLGTAILVLFGCGTAVISGPNVLMTAIAFGLSIIIGAYAVAKISGCHVNPAVSLAMFINGRMSAKDFVGYIVAQFAGAFAGSGLLYAILSCCSFVDKITLGANGYDDNSILGITMSGAILVEIILTFVFVYTILTVTAKAENARIAGIIIALTLVAVHLVGIQLTGTSVNPARSLAPAVLEGGKALEQAIIFIIAPFAGATAAACIYKVMHISCEEAAKPAKKTNKK